MDAGAANLTHCPISRCHTEPGYCEESASTDSILGLVSIILLPILISTLAPSFGRGGQQCSLDDDTPELRATDVRGVDPPMFLCGIGLLPLDCGLSGLLTVIVALGFGFAIVFFSLLLSDRPCTTSLGACRTISCACGNLIPEGYVFMFALLSMTSAFLVQRFSAMVQHHRIQHRTMKPTLIAGSLALTLTAIFPERYDANSQMGGYLSALYGLHLVGVGGSTFALLVVPFGWFFEHWLTHRKEVPVRSLLARLTYVLATLGFGIGFSVFASDSEIVDQVNDYCRVLTTSDECDGWPLLTNADCHRALSCLVNGSATTGNASSDDSLCQGAFQPNFRCAWEPNVQLTPWTRLIAPSTYVSEASCQRIACPLTVYARGVALEFALLFLTLCYTATFTLHDMRRLLDRPPPPGGRIQGSPYYGDAQEAYRDGAAEPTAHQRRSREYVANLLATPAPS